MKKLTFFSVLLSAVLCTLNVNAQDDFSKGTDYHIIYLDPATKALIPAASIKKDFTVDDTNHFLYVWDNTYTSINAAGPNWNGEVGEYLAFQVGTAGWSGFGFACDPAGTATKDMSAVTGDFTLHVAMKATGTSTHCIMMEGGDGISARVAVGASSFVDGANVTAAYTDFTRDGQWHLVEIPMSEFFNKGLRYPAPMKGNVFALLSGGVAGTTISLDAIFIYRKVVSGVNDAKEDRFDIVITDKTISAPGTASGIELFDITGRKLRTSSEAIMGIENLSQGIYIVRCDNKTKKIQIK